MPRNGIEQAGFRALAMEEDALLDERDGEGGRMRALLVAGVDGFVGDEPVVAAAAEVGAAGVAPAGDVRLVDVGHAGRAAVELDTAGFRQVKHILVAVVDVTLRVDRFEMTGADLFAGGGLDGDGLDPVERVLQDEERLVPVGQREDELVRHQRIRRSRADVEEERGVVRHHALQFRRPLAAPGEELLARRGVLEGSCRRCRDCRAAR